MANKVLIFFPHQLKQRHGGPYSMLYHLQKGLKDLTNEVYFLSDLITLPVSSKQAKPDSTSFFRSFKRLLPKRWVYDYRIENWVKEVSLPDKKILQRINVSQYDVLHFHETIDVWRYRSFLEDFHGRIVLTSHSPKPYHLEHLEDVMKLTKKDISSKSYSLMEAIDLFAYSKADHLVFPCKEATEPYVDCWPAFKNIMRTAKMNCIPTGVVPSHYSESAQALRTAMNIPADAFVITYVGRKIPVKGYDLLKKAAENLLENYKDIYFVVVGKKDETDSFKHDQWIETGWTDDPFSYIEAGDLHVVPNRYTNFDLNVLEVLSLGKPMLLSNTGGNKYFRQFNTAGIFYHEPEPNDLIEKVSFCYSQKAKLPVLGRSNLELYKANFTADRFAKDHLQFYNSMR